MAKQIDLTPYLIDIWASVARSLVSEGRTCNTDKRKLAKETRECQFGQKSILKKYSRKRAYIIKQLKAAGYLVESKDPRSWGGPYWDVLKFLEESQPYAVEPEDWLQPYKESLLEDLSFDCTTIGEAGYVCFRHLPAAHTLHYFWHPELYDTDDAVLLGIRPKGFYANIDYTVARQICLSVFEEEYSVCFEEVTGVHIPTEVLSDVCLDVHYFKNMLFRNLNTESHEIHADMSQVKAEVDLGIKYMQVLMRTVENIVQTVNKHGGLKALNNKILKHVVETMVINAPLHLGNAGEWTLGRAEYVLKHPDEFRYEQLFPVDIEVIDAPVESSGNIADMEKSIAILEGRAPEDTED